MSTVIRDLYIRINIKITSQVYMCIKWNFCQYLGFIINHKEPEHCSHIIRKYGLSRTSLYFFVCLLSFTLNVRLKWELCIKTWHSQTTWQLWVTMWQNTGDSMEQEFCMTSLDWVEYSTQSVWNVCTKFDTWKNIENCTVLEGNSVKIKPYK